jgi:hypothetical protein
MSRQKIRDERPEDPPQRARAEGPRQQGGESSEGLPIASEAVGREEWREEPAVRSEDVSRSQASADRQPLRVAGPEAEMAERPETPQGRHSETVRQAPDLPPPLEEPTPAPPDGVVLSAPPREPPAEASGAPSEQSRRAAEATARRWFQDGLVTAPQARAISQLIGEGEPGPEALDRLVEAGIITRSQAAAVRRRQHPNGLRPEPLAASSRPRPDAPAVAKAAELGIRTPRLSIDGRKLGAFLAAIALVGLAWAGVSLVMDVIGTPRRPVGVALLDSMRLLAGVLALVGGRRMYRGVQNGKPLALIGLVIYGLASALLAVRRLGDPVVIALILGWALLYYLTTVSRLRPISPAHTAPGSE